MTPRQQMVAQKAARGIAGNKRTFATYREYQEWMMTRGK